MADTRTSDSAPALRPPIPVRLLIGTVAAVGANALIAFSAHAAGVSDAFAPLQAGAYVTLTILGFWTGALGWGLIARFAKDPGRIIRPLIPAVLVLTFIPDVLVGLGDQPGISLVAVLALMLMHMVTAGTLAHGLWPTLNRPTKG